jgi:hypothetical protein
MKKLRKALMGFVTVLKNMQAAGKDKIIQFLLNLNIHNLKNHLT